MNFICSIACLLATATPCFAAVKEAPDPAKIKDKVTLAVGKDVAVQFQQEGNALSAPKIVEKPDGKTPAVTFTFKKEAELLMLNTKNPFTKTFSFRALIRLKGRKDYKETSIIAIPAGLFSFESWGDPIEEIVLFDFKLTDEK
jgi:hypothetical protein